MPEMDLAKALGKDSPISNPTRFALLVTLAKEGALSMAQLKEKVALTYGNLDSHLKKLVTAKYIRSKRIFTWGGPRTVFVATREGYLAAIDQANVLRSLLDVPNEPPAQVFEMFVLKEDGRVLAHENLRPVPGVDSELVGATLSALQDFVQASWKGDELESVHFGTRRLLVRRKGSIGIALVLGTGSVQIWEKRIPGLLDRLDERYAKAVKEWSGDQSELSGLMDEVRRFLDLHDET